jgi:hypothetical protein
MENAEIDTLRGSEMLPAVRRTQNFHKNVMFFRKKQFTNRDFFDRIVRL